MQAIKLLPINDKDNLVKEYARNKAQADALVDRNREIARKLAEMAEFSDGSKTGHMLAGGFNVTVALKENVRWDQDSLDKAFQGMGDEFLKPFKYKWEPRSKKALDAFMSYATDAQKKAVEVSMSSTPGQPQIKLESLED